MAAALRRFLAILVADLKERTRSPRFWLLLGAIVIVTWYCFPAKESGYMVLALENGWRGEYSSAWVGLVLAMAYSLVLGLGGFYMVRGTLVRDFETRVWQLLVATPMTRAGFLLAKWASHMLVFAVLIGAGLVVGLFAQWLRAEDHHFDLVEAIKPILVLSLPGLATTAAAAVWFDLVPWLRRTAGNVLFFILWVVGLSVGVSQLDVEGSPARTTWVSDAHGLMLVARDFQRVRTAQTGKPADFGFSLGSSRAKHGVHTFAWQQWHPRPMDVAGRALWLGLSIGLVLLAAPLLDRCAASSTGIRSRATGGLRLRLLDPLLRPFARGAFGVLAVAELKLVLRERRPWWWLAALALLGVQAFGTSAAAATAMLLALALPLDLLSRGVLREGEHRTGELVFTAPRMLGRLLAVRLFVPVALLFALTLPGLLRLLGADPVSALAGLVVIASIASWGLALGALCRNPRPFELLLVGAIYVALQGASLFALGAQQASTTLAWHALALLPAWALLAWTWPRMARRAAR
jgi:hypothetical protein